MLRIYAAYHRQAPGSAYRVPALFNHSQSSWCSSGVTPTDWRVEIPDSLYQPSLVIKKAPDLQVPQAEIPGTWLRVAQS